MALAVEAAETTELFQWLSEDESRNLDQKTLKKQEKEIDDVRIYLARLADQLGISPIKADMAKINKNRKKYPVRKSRGIAKKYSEFGR
ncbi:MAG: MazG-like family protein [Clostridiales bacterium]|nr:MazG-like family protein [Clostridiales bacterium]